MTSSGAGLLVPQATSRVNGPFIFNLLPLVPSDVGSLAFMHLRHRPKCSGEGIA